MVRDGDIQRIVREVLQRLERLSAAAASPQEPPLESPPARGSALEFPVLQRVVTLATLENLPGGVRRIVLEKDAILTPAARDELVRRGIEVSRRARQANGGQASLQLIVGVNGQDRYWDQLCRAIPGGLLEVDRIEFVELRPIVRYMADAIGACHRKLGLILTPDPQVALCAANRLASLRAAWGVEPSAVQSAIDALAANVLVVNPAATNPAGTIKMVRQFVAAGPRECPPQFLELLESAC